MERQRRTLLVIALGAAAIILTQTTSVALQLGTLVHELGSPLGAALVTGYFRASAAKVLIATLALIAALAFRRRDMPVGWAIVGLGVLLALAGAWTSHAAARLQHRTPLLALDMLHQLAAGVWIGGLLHLVVAASSGRDGPWPASLLRRFSAVSLAAVLLLCASGMGLSFYYIDSWEAVLGTGYGLMVLTKVVMLGGLAALGATNFLTVRKLPALPAPTGANSSLTVGGSLVGLRRFVEVELGMGLTVFFAAASLTS